MVVSTKYLISLFILFSMATVASAQVGKVVVIPLGGDAAPLQNVITVSNKNGDFTDPVAAMNSIAGMADANNRYLLVIGPGVYTLTETLVMQPYVDITGSGRDATLLTGSISTGTDDATSSLIHVAHNSSLRSLSIENTGGSMYSTGVYINFASPQLSDLRISVSGGSSSSTGVRSKTSAKTYMENLDITVSGGGRNSYGIRNSYSSPTLMNMIIAVSGGTLRNYGVANTGTSVNTSRIINSSVVVNDGAAPYNYGLFISISSVVVSGVEITVVGGAQNYGVYNADATASAVIRNSRIHASSGTSRSVAANTGSGQYETYVSDSILKGSVTGNPKCSFSFRSTGVALDNSCIPF